MTRKSREVFGVSSSGMLDIFVSARTPKTQGQFTIRERATDKFGKLVTVWDMYADLGPGARWTRRSRGIEYESDARKTHVVVRKKMVTYGNKEAE